MYFQIMLYSQIHSCFCMFTTITVKMFVDVLHKTSKMQNVLHTIQSSDKLCISRGQCMGISCTITEVCQTGQTWMACSGHKQHKSLTPQNCEMPNYAVRQQWLHDNFLFVTQHRLHLTVVSLSYLYSSIIK